ncbi:hypothetical protein K7X08_001265 [Anisodus acutangulus]|uniref:4-hydroxy-4-methyl-2-oxoglutarate aldolase n=1 Tax=Anisodus acutangulus TaxID=402998 RepID=A0A9Q1MRZ3_9SOLA|nr:hypothetical protein K7X08_001265 [Anisodus acutangulus]
MFKPKSQILLSKARGVYLLLEEQIVKIQLQRSTDPDLLLSFSQLHTSQHTSNTIICIQVFYVGWPWSPLLKRQVFSGPVVTLKVFEDNVLVREFLEEKGNGRVLVVDGGGSLRCAILGGNPVVQGQNNGWAGIVVNGCVRDVDEINGCDIGVRALASHPMKANKKGIGEKHVPITIAGTRVCDGEWLYADTDGILISKMELSV